VKEHGIELELCPHFFHKNVPIHRKHIRVGKKNYIIMFTLNPGYQINETLLKICPTIAWRGEVMALALGSACIKKPRLLSCIPGASIWRLP
jgi:hypothetical protein